MDRKIIVAFMLVILSIGLLLPRDVIAQQVQMTQPSHVEAVKSYGLISTGTPEAEGIIYPRSGETISGVVDIKGTTSSAWDLYFSYQNSPLETWFYLSESKQKGNESILVSWDTASVVDGVYILRLRMFLTGDVKEEEIVLRVENNSPTLIIFSTPTPIKTLDPFPTSTLTEVSVKASEPISNILPLSTSLPALHENPAILYPRDIISTLGKGVLLVFVVFSFSGFIIFLKKKL